MLKKDRNGTKARTSKMKQTQINLTFKASSRHKISVLEKAKKNRIHQNFEAEYFDFIVLSYGEKNTIKFSF